jgi:hypothetical protein
MMVGESEAEAGDGPMQMSAFAVFQRHCRTGDDHAIRTRSAISGTWQATRIELIISMRTAKEFGLTLPLTLLNRADEVIQLEDSCGAKRRRLRVIHVVWATSFAMLATP